MLSSSPPFTSISLNTALKTTIVIFSHHAPITKSSQCTHRPRCPYKYKHPFRRLHNQSRYQKPASDISRQHRSSIHRSSCRSSLRSKLLCNPHCPRRHARCDVPQNLIRIRVAGWLSIIAEKVPPEGFSPLTSKSTDAELDTRVWRCEGTFYHTAGTASMGRVVDAECQVKGWQGYGSWTPALCRRPLARITWSRCMRLRSRWLT